MGSSVRATKRSHERGRTKSTQEPTNNYKNSPPSSYKSKQHYEITNSTKYAVGEAFVGKEHHRTQADPRENNNTTVRTFLMSAQATKSYQRKSTTRTTSIAL